MDKVFNHTAHRELWDWLSKNPDVPKENWPKWEENGGEYQEETGHYCFACYYDDTECSFNSDIPNNCPLEWPGNSRCYSGTRLFHVWVGSEESERAALAEQIRDLPVKPDVK